jgi:hypothetical protein
MEGMPDDCSNSQYEKTLSADGADLADFNAFSPGTARQGRCA